MAEFDTDLLTQAFSEVFYRRPVDVKLSGGGQINIGAGKNAQINVIGKYLEGNCSLFSDNQRISIQQVQQYGTLENTSLTAVANATIGSDISNIGLYGYVAGQNDNETAKFKIQNAINIVDTTPVIYDFSTNIYNNAYPESIVFNISANEDVVSYIVNGKPTPYNEVVYTYNAPGIYTATVQGVNSEGILSNIVSKPITVLQRPYIRGVYIQKNPSQTDFQMFQTVIAGLAYDKSPITGQTIPYVTVQFNSQARLKLILDYVAGGLGVTLGSTTLRNTTTYQQGVTSVVSKSADPAIIYIDAYNLNQYYIGANQVILLIYPKNTIGTEGYMFEIGINLYGYLYPTYRIVDSTMLPSPTLAPTYNVFGNIVPYANVQGVILPSNYGVIRESVVTKSVSASIIGY